MWILALDFHLSFTEMHFCILPGKNAVQCLSFYKYDLLLPLQSVKGEYKSSEKNIYF